MELRKCPNCYQDVDYRLNRLITENCGHIKCRECFILEINGCIECQRNTINISKNYSAKADQVITLDLERDFNNIVDTENSSNEGLRINTDSNNSNSYQILNLVNNHSDNDIQHNNINTLDNNYQTIITNQNEQKNTDSNDICKVKKNKKSFPSHIIKYTEGSKSYFKCTICDRKFQSRNQQYYHLYCDNKDRKPFKCKICSKSFASSSHLNYHMDSHSEPGKYQCKICSKNFSGKITFEKHSGTHENIFKYSCDKCSSTFRNKSSLTAHLNKHNNHYPFICSMCDKRFSFKSNLTQHLLSHTGTKRFQCNQCAKYFTRKSTYHEHLQRHTKSKKYLCQLCTKPFIDRKTLDRHMKIHSTDLLVCPFCNINSARKDNLIRHIRNMHPKENMKEAIDKIKNNKVSTNVLPNENIQESQTTINNDLQITQTIPALHIPAERTFIVTSVIKSIGNVQPVQFAEDCDNNLNIENKMNKGELITEKNPIEKTKKKYDPFEIYRKILSVSNEDDSILENEQLHSHYRDDNEHCCENFINNIEDNIQINLNNSSNF